MESDHGLEAAVGGAGAIAGELASELSEGKHYAGHLAAMSNSNASLAAEDIYNAHGALIVKKGAVIDEHVASRILQHRLVKPFNEQVELSDVLDRIAIREAIHDLYDAYPDLHQLLACNGLLSYVDQLCMTFRLTAQVAQLLTVQAAQQSRLFDKTLFCAVLCVVIAKTAGEDDEVCHDVFLAGLVHDVGLLYVQPDILNKSGALEADEWRAIQSHTLIGRLLLERMSGISEITHRAVVEHHERCDGTGYPRGLTEGQLGMAGQIIAMADSLQAIRMDKFAKTGRNLANTVPYLQMNNTTHTFNVYSAMRTALKRSELTPVCRLDADMMVSVATDSKRRIEAFSGIRPVLLRIHELTAPIQKTRQGRACHRLSSRVVRMLDESGLLQEEIGAWLGGINRDTDCDETAEELDTTDLMLDELGWQLSTVRRTLNALLHAGNPLPPPVEKALHDCLAKLDAVLARPEDNTAAESAAAVS